MAFLAPTVQVVVQQWAAKTTSREWPFDATGAAWLWQGQSLAFIGANVWVIALATTVAIIAYLRAVSAAEQWGRWVRAAFDLFRSALAEKVGLTEEMSLADSKRFWNLFGRAITYGEPTRLEDIEAAFPSWKALRPSPQDDANGSDNQGRAP